ncbi:hypothetical protein Glove_57g11 [Diversispora epigaea]|uniref:Uncharacterized protein n=1 Tax=Diversispora epigaea TaxID=1348612 RepID=A0A397JM58_9GLOM|nr:hypothetical protein Glove_57g11 [Diversispora epigaea]
MSSLLCLIARFSRPALHTLRQRVFSLTSQKRRIASDPISSDKSGAIQPIQLPSSASLFKKREYLVPLKVSFVPANDEKEVIPEFKGTNSGCINPLSEPNTHFKYCLDVNIQEEYVCTGIDRKILQDADFNVYDHNCITDPDIQTFLYKLHDVVFNGLQIVGTCETFTDTLVDDLLRIAKLNSYPFKIRNHPPCKLYIGEESCISSVPEFVVKNENFIIVGVEPGSDYGELQMAIEILACGDENKRLINLNKWTDQTIYAVRVISTFVTFYKTTISKKYWDELIEGFPKTHSVVIQRWPGENGMDTGLDLSEPNGRKAILTAFSKIRQSFVK